MFLLSQEVFVFFLKVYFAVDQFQIITSGVGWVAKFCLAAPVAERLRALFLNHSIISPLLSLLLDREGLGIKIKDGLRQWDKLSS